MATATGVPPNFRRSRVIDASIAAAMVFGDSAAELGTLDFRERFFVAPSVIRYEFTHICVKKHRRGLIDSERMLKAWNEFESLGISTESVSFPEATAAAIRYRVSGYDAAYLWMAISQRIELLTLDRELNKAWRLAAKESTP